MLTADFEVEPQETSFWSICTAGNDALQMEPLKQKLTKLKSGSILITKEEREQVEKVMSVQMHQCSSHAIHAPGLRASSLLQLRTAYMQALAQCIDCDKCTQSYQKYMDAWGQRRRIFKNIW